jgi:hypothetical protein
MSALRTLSTSSNEHLTPRLEDLLEIATYVYVADMRYCQMLWG